MASSQRIVPIGLGAGGFAVAVGSARMAMLDAPPALPIVHAATFLLFGLALTAATRSPTMTDRQRDWAIAACGAAILATAVWGAELHGVRRWLQVGSLRIQPGLVLTPAMIVLAGVPLRRIAALGLVLAALGFALQPDRAMAAALAAGVAGTAARRNFDRTHIAVLAAALAGLSVALVRADPLPGVEHVEGVLRRGLQDGPAVALLLLVSLGVSLAPALWSAGAGAGFAGAWIAVILASGLGNYPTPLIGYGPSSIVGYLLSVWALSVTSRRR